MTPRAREANRGARDRRPKAAKSHPAESRRFDPSNIDPALILTRISRRSRPTIRERADAWLSRVNVAQAAREIVRMLYDALGSASIYSERSPLDRALRDAETVCQHIVMQRKTLGMAGAMLLEADTPLLPYI